MSIVYIPVFNNNKWDVVAVDKNTARYRHTPGYNAMIIYQGTIYNGDNIYSCPEGAWAYIHKDYVMAFNYQVAF